MRITNKETGRITECTDIRVDGARVIGTDYAGNEITIADYIKDTEIRERHRIFKMMLDVSHQNYTYKAYFELEDELAEKEKAGNPKAVEFLKSLDGMDDIKVVP